MLETSLEFSYEVDLEKPIDVGRGPNGRRMVYNITGGRVTGERINGHVLPGRRRLDAVDVEPVGAT
jgi:hypothetical protein